ncbi:MAG: hypothetical protein ABI130_10275 [Leifsonia sp.]
MPDLRVLPSTEESPDGTSLALIRLPYAFTQDRLLRSEEFVEEAGRMDIATSIEELEELRRAGLLVPLFRIDDEGSARYILNVPESNRSDLAAYARAGQVRDPALDSDPSTFPIEPAARRTDEGRYWDGYYFARWQLLALRYAQTDHQWYLHGEALDRLQEHATRLRQESILLSALAPRHLPGIWGQESLPGGGDFDDFRDAKFVINDEARLRLAGAKPQDLLGPAEFLLTSAKGHDPLIGWWPLIRHSDYRGWEKLTGIALYSLWQRIAAEILLRAHEHLAESQLVEPLPAETEGHFWKPLFDRISAREADGLDQALGSLGLSPHPRVMLIVEGETELLHVSRLLEEFGIARPNLVRVLNLQGSNKSPRELARYVTAPRLGQVRFGRQYLAATPTALYVAMDPENLWKSEDDCALERAKIQTAIREEVEAQGATISQNELDVLVHVFTWGQHKYELANFTDDELIEALTRLAQDDNIVAARSLGWREDVRQQLQTVRAEHHDIKVALGRLHIPVRKVRLAELLLPDLLAQLAPESIQLSPVLEMVREVNQLVHRLSGGGYVLNGASETN